MRRLSRGLSGPTQRDFAGAAPADAAHASAYPSGMSHPIPPEEPEFELPEVNASLLDAAGLEALLRDIELCTELLEIVPKFSRQELIVEPAGRLTVADARELMRSGAVRGVQIRYRHEGAEWWDTLMNQGEGWRLVRIRHEWA